METPCFCLKKNDQLVFFFWGGGGGLVFTIFSGHIYMLQMHFLFG